MSAYNSQGASPDGPGQGPGSIQEDLRKLDVAQRKRGLNKLRNVHRREQRGVWLET